MSAIAINSPSRDPYLDWLVSLTGPLGASYQISLEAAYRVLFDGKFIPNDINRAIDGIELRVEYQELFGKEPNISAPCRFLEMLLALARRMNDIVYGYDNPEAVIDWFWALMGNLRILELPDHLVDPITELDIRKRFINVVNRNYRANGNGGLFPLDDPEEDQRQVEIWYQMQAWLDQEVDY